MPKTLQAQVLAADRAIVPDLIAILEDALTDGEIDHGWTPAHAAKLLGMLGGVQAVPVLLRFLERYDVMDSYHREAADALVMLDKPAIDACLEAYPTTNNDDMHAGIASVLSRCATKDERSYQTLLDFFARSPELGAIYLAEYGDSRAIPALSQMFDALPVHDQDDSVVSNHGYTSNKVAQSLLEFSTNIPRTHLRPSYGEGFLGAPIQIGTRQESPTPPAQGDARGSSKSSTSSTPGDASHV